MRKGIIGLSLLLTISLIPAYSATPPKEGSACSKQGIARTYQGKKFTCIKSGKNLMWNKGVVIKTPSPSPSPSPSPTPTPTPMPTPTPTPMPTPTPTPMPTPTPTLPKMSFIEILRSPQIEGTYPISLLNFSIPSKLPQSWSDVYENRAGIPYKAWLSISDAVRDSKSALGTIKIAKGPNTLLPFNKTEAAMELVSKAFSSAPQPAVVDLIAFNYQDQAWADEVYRKLIADESDSFKRNHQNYVLDMCSSSRKVCWSAMGFTRTNGNGVILLGIVEWERLRALDDSYSSYARSEEGLTIAHEYFHTIQRKILDKNWFVMEYTPPIWFNESSAIYVENGAMNFESFDRYMRFRAVDSKLAYSSCGTAAMGCIPISEEILVDFLSLRNYSTNWNNFPYGMKYEVSQRVIEVLVALKGHRAIIDVYAYMAQNHTFEQAFLHVFGIPYVKAVPVLAKIVAEQFANDL